MVDVLGSLVARPDDDFLVIVKIVGSDGLYLLTHRGGEKQGITVGRYASQNFVYTPRKAHIEHFVGLVEHHVFHCVKFGYTAFHQVDEAARRSYDYLRPAFQASDLAFNTGTAVDSNDLQTVDIAGIIFQVTRDLQAQLAGRAEDDGLRVVLCRVYLLQHGQAIGRRLAGTGLRQGDDVVARTEQIGNHFFLYGHRSLVAHFFYCAAQLLADAQLFKCFQVVWELNIQVRLQSYCFPKE